MNGSKTGVLLFVTVSVCSGIVWKHLHDQETAKQRAAAMVAINQALGPSQAILKRHAGELGFVDVPSGIPVNSKEDFLDSETEVLRGKTGSWGPAERQAFEERLVHLYQATTELAKAWDYGLKPKIDFDRSGIEISPTSPEVQRVIDAARRLQAAADALDNETSEVASVRRSAYEAALSSHSTDYAIANYQTDQVLVEAALDGKRIGREKLIADCEDAGYALIHDGRPLSARMFSDSECRAATLRGEAKGRESVDAAVKKETGRSVQTLQGFQEFKVVQAGASIRVKVFKPEFISATMRIVQRYCRGPLPLDQVTYFDDTLSNIYEDGVEVVNIMNQIVQSAAQKAPLSAGERRTLLARLIPLRKGLEKDTTDMYNEEVRIRDSRPVPKVTSVNNPGILDSVNSWSAILDCIWKLVRAASIVP